MLRILGVWGVALTVASLIGGGGDGFMLVFALLGFFMTIPALVLLGLASAIEGAVLRASGPFAAAWVGIGIGLLVPVGLYAIAPNPENAKQALAFLAPLSLGTGVLWSLSGIVFPRRQRWSA